MVIVTVTSTYEGKILEWDGKPQTNDQKKLGGYNIK